MDVAATNSAGKFVDINLQFEDDVNMENDISKLNNSSGDDNRTKAQSAMGRLTGSLSKVLRLRGPTILSDMAAEESKPMKIRSLFRFFGKKNSSKLSFEHGKLSDETTQPSSSTQSLKSAGRSSSSVRSIANFQFLSLMDTYSSHVDLHDGQLSNQVDFCDKSDEEQGATLEVF